MPAGPPEGRDDGSTMTGPSALAVTDLSYAYTRQRPTLSGIDLEVPAGSFTALLGPNGAGKTTLMALITRLFEAGSGQISVCGHDLKHATRPALAAMGVVFQRLTLDLDLTVEQNLRYAAALHGLGREPARERIRHVIERLGIEPQRQGFARTLSGGQKRRVEIARALLHRPRLLVCDEATVGLDIDSRRSLVEQVHTLCREEGLAVLWATHLIDEIWEGDRVVILHQGTVRAAGSFDEVAGGGTDTGLAGAYQRFTRTSLAA